MNKWFRSLLVAMALLAACTSPPPPVPITAPADVAGAAVIRRAVPESAPPASATGARPEPASPSTVAPINVPPGTQYVCVTESNGARQQTAIEFVPKVRELCTKHPEMGPCQYERNVCRGAGGRVYDAAGTEITLQTEAEYDKKVMRVRFKAN